MTTPRDELADRGDEPLPTIKVVGVGGAGCTIVNELIAAGIPRAACVAVDTDGTALVRARAAATIQIPEGPDGRPNWWRLEEMLPPALYGADVIVIVAALGGQTATRAVSEARRCVLEMGYAAHRAAMEAGQEYDNSRMALMVEVVTMPLTLYEDTDWEEISRYFNFPTGYRGSLITIPCDWLPSALEGPAERVFKEANDILVYAVQQIYAALTTYPGAAQAWASLAQRYPALLGIGSAPSRQAVGAAVRDALDSPLLGDPIASAAGVLCIVTNTGDRDATVDAAMASLKEVLAPNTPITCQVVPANLLRDEAQAILIVEGFQEQHDLIFHRDDQAYEAELARDYGPPAHKAGEPITDFEVQCLLRYAEDFWHQHKQQGENPIHVLVLHMAPVYERWIYTEHWPMLGAWTIDDRGVQALRIEEAEAILDAENRSRQEDDVDIQGCYATAVITFALVKGTTHVLLEERGGPTWGSGTVIRIGADGELHALRNLWIS